MTKKHESSQSDTKNKRKAKTEVILAVCEVTISLLAVLLPYIFEPECSSILEALSFF